MTEFDDHVISLLEMELGPDHPNTAAYRNAYFEGHSVVPAAVMAGIIRQLGPDAWGKVRQAQARVLQALEPHHD